MTEVIHGMTGYSNGCKCYVCCWIHSQWKVNRLRQIREGTWYPWEDAEPARQHVLDLLSRGYTVAAVAAAARDLHTTVTRLLYGRPSMDRPPPPKIRPDTATRLLSVNFEPLTLPDVVQIDSTGMRRRFQALSAAGWPVLEQCRDSGLDHVLFARHRPRVTVATLRRVHETYRRLQHLDPSTRVGVRAVTQARNTAIRHGWAPPTAWDDDTIDDVQVAAEWTGACGTPRGYKMHYEFNIRPVCDRCRAAHSERRKLEAMR